MATSTPCFLIFFVTWILCNQCPSKIINCLKPVPIFRRVHSEGLGMRPFTFMAYNIILVHNVLYDTVQ